MSKTPKTPKPPTPPKALPWRTRKLVSTSSTHPVPQPPPYGSDPHLRIARMLDRVPVFGFTKQR
jgi:hypothetical protein